MTTTDVLIICALKEELDALLEVSAEVSEGWVRVESEPPHFSATLQGDAGAIRVAAACATEMGIGAATGLAVELGKQLGPGCYAMCGVCAGHPDDTDFGDVIIADRVFQYDSGKLTTDGLKGDVRTHVLAESWTRVAQELAGAAKQRHGYALPDDNAAKWWFLERLFAKRDPKKSAFDRYFPAPRQAAMLESLLEQELVSLERESFGLTEKGRDAVTRHRAIYSTAAVALPYHVHTGPMGSGSYVVADGDTWDHVASRGMRKILGLEMEAVAIGSVAHRESRRFVVAKGVMDHGDPQKRDQFKAFAARASAEVLCALLRRVVVPSEPQDSKVERRSVTFAGPKPDVYFRGRDSELAKLAELLRSNRTVCVVVTGIGGVGKTMLVAEFSATTARELYPDGILWLDGRPEQLTAELARVSRRLGWSDRREPTPAEAVKLIAANLTGKRVLVVVDSFDPVRTRTTHVPLVDGGSRTLVTSRTRTLDVDLDKDAVRLDLGVWPIEVCRSYLHERCEHLMNTPAADVDALAEFVGRLPLGVRLLVSVLRHRPGTSGAQILELLRAQPLGMLDKYAGNRGVAATFRVGYDDLLERECRVLQALAVCARQTRLEVVAAVAAVADTGEALDELHTRGFAELAAGGGWGMHDVVRMFVAEQAGREVFETAHTGWVHTHMQEHNEATAHQAFGAGVAEARRAFERLVTTDLDLADSIYRPLEEHLTIVGNFPEATALSERLLEVSPADSKPALAAMNNLGICYGTLGDTAKAIEFFERALAVEMRLCCLHGQATQLGNLGICYKTLGDVPGAIDFHQRAFAIDEKLGHLQGQANHLGNLGTCYMQIGDIPKAIDFHQRSLAIDEKLGHLQGQAKALCSLGNCYQELGDIPKAIDFHERSFAIDEKLGHLQGQARGFGNFGNCYMRLGDIPKAVEFHSRSLVIDEKLGHLQGQAIALGNLGSCYQQLGEIPKAIDFHERSVALAEKVGHLGGQVRNLRNLGLCYATLGDIPKAIEFHERSLAIDEKRGYLQGQVRHLDDLGVCYMKLGDIPRAIDVFERSLAILGELGLHEGPALLCNLGKCYQELGDIPKAIDLLKRALAIYEKLDRPEGQANPLAILGLIAAEHGSPKEARGYLSRAIELFLRMGLPDDDPRVAMASDVLVAAQEVSHSTPLK